MAGRILFLAALASAGDAGAEVVLAGTLREPASIEGDHAGGPPAPDSPSIPERLAAPSFTVTAPRELRPEGLFRVLDAGAQTLLRELHAADGEVGLDSYLAELRANALGVQRPGPAPAACAGPACGSRFTEPRAERSIEDQRLLEALIDFRADVRDVFTPLQTIYQDSGLKTLLETARSDDLVFGTGRSGPDAVTERGLYEARGDGPAPGRRESSTEVLALIRFIGNFWQVMRDFGIPIILMLILIRGVFWIVKVQRAQPRRDVRQYQPASGDFTPSARPVFRTSPERRDFKEL